MQLLRVFNKWIGEGDIKWYRTAFIITTFPSKSHSSCRSPPKPVNNLDCLRKIPPFTSYWWHGLWKAIPPLEHNFSLCLFCWRYTSPRFLMSPKQLQFPGARENISWPLYLMFSVKDIHPPCPPPPSGIPAEIFQTLLQGEMRYKGSTILVQDALSSTCFRWDVLSPSQVPTPPEQCQRSLTQPTQGCVIPMENQSMLAMCCDSQEFVFPCHQLLAPALARVIHLSALCLMCRQAAASGCSTELN